MSRLRIECVARAVAAATALGALLVGCSDPGLYLDRRDTIALSGGDSVDANMVEQMVDPWPRYSNNNNIAFNGERMQRAVNCYREDKVTPPVDLDPTDDSSSSSSSAPSAPPVAAATSCGDQSSFGGAQPEIAPTLGSTAAK